MARECGPRCNGFQLAAKMIYRRPSPRRACLKDIVPFLSFHIFCRSLSRFVIHSVTPFFDNAMWFKGALVLSYTALLVTPTNAIFPHKGMV